MFTPAVHLNSHQVHRRTHRPGLRSEDEESDRHVSVLNQSNSTLSPAQMAAVYCGIKPTLLCPVDVGRAAHQSSPCSPPSSRPIPQRSCRRLWILLSNNRLSSDLSPEYTPDHNICVCVCVTFLLKVHVHVGTEEERSNHTPSETPSSCQTST